MKAGGPTKMQVTSLKARKSMISENVRVHFEVPTYSKCNLQFCRSPKSLRLVQILL